MKKTGKFFIGLSTAAVLMAAAPMAVASAQAAENDALELAYGDINEDGNVTVADAVAILQYIGNKDKYFLTDKGKRNADVDGVAGITGSDALTIQKYDAGLINEGQFIRISA